MEKLRITVFMFLIAVNLNDTKAKFLESIDLENHWNFESLANCIVKISKIDLYYKPVILILKKDIKNAKENAFVNSIIDIIVKNQRPMFIIEDNALIKTEFHQGNIITIVYFDNCESFSNIGKYIEEKQVKYLIIVDHDIEKNCMSLFKETGKDVNLHSITFLVKDCNNGDYKVISFVPEIDRNTCKIKNNLPPIHLNTCKNGTIDEVTSYPVKSSRNFQKCPLKIGMSSSPPFSVIPNDNDLKPFDKVEIAKGSDVEIVKILAEFFNATLFLHFGGKPVSNPLLINFIDYLVNGSLHVCAGGMFRVYGDIVEYSGIYNKQTIIWIYNVERVQRSWSIFAQKIKDMYVFLIFYILYCIFWKLFSLFDGTRSCFKDTLLYSFGSLIGTSSLQEAKTLKTKILNLFYLIMCIYLSLYISAQMYVFLTIQLPPELLKTNEDVMNSGRPPILDPKTKNFTSDTNYIKYAESSLDCSDFIDCEKKVLLQNGITLTFDGTFYSFQEATSVNYEARVLRTNDNMLTVYHEMLISKNSSIVRNLQKVIKRLFEAGICDKLYFEAIGITTVDRANSYSKNIKKNSYSCKQGCKITLDQAAGIFYFWLCGCILSLCVFVFELFYCHC